MKNILLLFLTLLSCSLSAQQIFTITGKVTDATSGEAVPFATISLKGTKTGATSDFEGFYTLKTKFLSDSLTASFLGYKNRSKVIDKKQINQKIDFQLEGSAFQLKEMVVHAGENPAWTILRKIIDNKPLNNKKKFTAYEYESYVRAEIDVSNISEKLKKKKLIGEIAGAADKIQKLAGEDGQPVLPVFVSETMSDYYFRDNPKKSREFIRKQNVTGVAFVDNDVVTTLIGSSFQEYNFYENYLRLLTKDFVSPICDGWRQNYDYYLKDSTIIGDNFCYVIEFDPKNKMDLAFRGQMWIDKKTYAIAQIDAVIGKEANLNYIEKVKIQQEFEQVDGKAWLPEQSRVVFTLTEITPGSASFVAKFYTSNRNFVIDKPRDNSFFDLAIEVSPDAKEPDDEYWQKNRHTPMSKEEKQVYAMIDTIRNLPIIKHYTNVLNVITTGHFKLGKVDLGPYPFAYAYNSFEGSRFRLGLRTNMDFSRNWFLKGHIAYGVHDDKFKYGLEATRVLTRRHYSDVTAYHSYDVEQLGVNYDDLGINYLTNTLFRGLSRFGTFRRPYYINETGVTFNIEPAAGLYYSFAVRNRTFSPNYSFLFRTKPDDGINSPVSSEFSNTEFFGEFRYARGEVVARNNRNRKIVLRKAREYPIITFRYSMGIKAFGGDFHYHKFSLGIQKSIRLGILGRAETELSFGYTPSTLPYPLLYVHQGNTAPVFVVNAYNLMNHFEFVSDHYAAFRFQHNFEGLITNRLPLLKKLNWRTHLTGKVLFGGVSNANQDITPPEIVNGKSVARFGSLDPKVPYVELGYGVSNIFKFLRVDFLHRLTYLENPDAPKFGVKVSFEIRL